VRVLDRFPVAFATSVGAYAGRLGLIGAMVLVGGGLEALVWARVGGELLLTVLQGGAAFVLLRSLLWDQRRAPISTLANRSKELRTFLLTTNLNGIVRLASTKLDTLLVGVLASPATVSIYKIGVQFSKVPLLAADSLHLAVFPIFARDFARNRIAAMRATARRASIYITVLAVPLFLIVAFEGQTLIAWLIGESFRSAGTTTAICLAGVLPYVIFFWLYSLLLTIGYVTTLLRIILIGTVAQIAAILILVPALGANGAAIGFALNYVVTVVLGLSSLQRTGIMTPHAANEERTQASLGHCG
jgi:O-antigen/teichoic acid export membrane protein